MSHYYPDEQLDIRKISYEAEAALLDFIELFADTIAEPVIYLADRVYCYCNIKGPAAVFRAFYTKGDKAFELRDDLDASTYAEIETEAAEQLELMRKLYSYCTDKMPSELFLDLDPLSHEVHALRADNSFTSVYDAEIRFKAWLKEHGGKGKPIGPRYHDMESTLLWKLLKIGEEKAVNPTAEAVEIDIKALQASREKVKKLETPSAKCAPVVRYDSSMGETGFLAIKDAFDERYPNDASPDYLYYQDVDDLRDDYKLVRKDYEYTLYEYIAIYEDEDCCHIVSLGMSKTGSESDAFYKHYDAEYTMRIKKFDEANQNEAERANAINLVSILADEACNKGRMLGDYSYVSLGFRKGVDYKRESDKVAFIIIPDARISSVEGPFGTVHLRQAVPITKAEYDALKSKEIDVRTLYEKIGSDLVDYDRPSVI